MQPTEQDIERDTAKDRFTKVLAALGLIAVLFGGSCLVVRYSPTVIRGIVAAAVSLSSKFTPGGGDAKLDLSSDKYDIASGEAFTLNWTNRDNDAGSYTISYPCQEGVRFEAVQGSTNEVIFCNTQFKFVNDNNHLTLIGYSIADENADVPLYLYFTKNGDDDSSLSDDVAITITNSGLAVNPPTPTPTPRQVTPTPGPGTSVTIPFPTTPGVPRDNPNGRVDLAARIIATGYIATSTNNAFVQTDSVKLSDRAAVKC